MTVRFTHDGYMTQVYTAGSVVAERKGYQSSTATSGLPFITVFARYVGDDAKTRTSDA